MNPTNDYLRELNGGFSSASIDTLPMWREDNNILFTPDGCKWRLEKDKTAADIIQVGDIIKTNYGTGGRVIKITKYEHCCCPLRDVSRVKLCCESWDEPIKTMKYHHVVYSWSIVYVLPKAEQCKDGSWREKDMCWLNELVCFDNRILGLYVGNDDEVFVLDKKLPLKIPIQLSLSL